MGDFLIISYPPPAPPPAPKNGYCIRLRCNCPIAGECRGVAGDVGSLQSILEDYLEVDPFKVRNVLWE